MTSIQAADAQLETIEISLTGKSLLENPLLNKGSAFSEEERREFGLLGLVPPHVSTTEEQLTRTYESYKHKSTSSNATSIWSAFRTATKHCSTDCCKSTSLR